MIRRVVSKLNISDRAKGAVIVASYILCIAVVALLWNAFLLSPLKVIGSSMNPSLDENDVVLTDRLSYRLHDPDRYDIIVFRYRYDNSRQLIKRVIGLPGETVEIIDGDIYINGSILKEYYGIYLDRENDKTVQELHKNYGPVTLGTDEYFVLGDNRNNSDDSRSDDVGILKGDDIIGKICFRLWPWNSIGSMKQQ